MSGPDPKAEVAWLLAPSIESIVAKGLNEDFPDGHECRVTHLPLDINTLQAICCMNLPKALVERQDDDAEFTDHGFRQMLYLKCERKDSSGPGDSLYYLNVTVTQCNSYVKAIKAMKDELLSKDDQETYGPTKNNKLGNYALESADGLRLIWVRYTTVVELWVENQDYDNCASPWIDTGRIAAALDKAMTEHEGSVSAVPKSKFHWWHVVPARFIVDEPQLVKFPCYHAHSHRRFELEGVNAFVVVNGHEYTDRSFDTEFSVTFRKKAKAKLVIRTAHKSSLWPSEHVYVLEA